MLQSLVSSCEFNGVNPFEYLKDVLIRVDGAIREAASTSCFRTTYQARYATRRRGGPDGYPQWACVARVIAGCTCSEISSWNFLARLATAL